MTDPCEDFFSNLPEFSSFEEAVSGIHHRRVPESWYVVVTDVRGSTAAVESGRYRDVNAIGVASIIGLKNAVPGIELPYVFGGDGATMLVPGSRLEAIDRALRGLRTVALEAFSLELRVSRVPIHRLDEAGAPYFAGRYRISPHVTLAAFSGAGVALAEEWIKSETFGAAFTVDDEGPSEVDLSGFECRWQPAESQSGTMISLLVVALDPEPSERQETYRGCLEVIDSCYVEGRAHPLSEGKLRLKNYGDDYSIEARLASQGPRAPSAARVEAKARRHTLAGRGLMKLGLSARGFNGATYMQQFLENTDFRKFDGALRMVLDVPSPAATTLEEYLEARYAEGRLAYGMHLSSAALITCMVQSYEGNHVHFVDGADGGYALAAKQLKERLKKLAMPG